MTTEDNNIPKIRQDDTPQLRIAITGKMRAGKDTFTEELAERLEKLDYEVHIIPFGEALKEYAHQLFPSEYDEHYKPRELYQWFGQTLRQRNPNIWIEHVAQAINVKNAKTFLYSRTDKQKVAHIITDLRQPNEYQFCLNNDFIIVKVECDDEERLRRMNNLGDKYTLEDLNHETEQYIDGFSEDFNVNTTEFAKKRAVGFPPLTPMANVVDKFIMKIKEYEGEI